MAILNTSFKAFFSLVMSQLLLSCNLSQHDLTYGQVTSAVGIIPNSQVVFVATDNELLVPQKEHTMIELVTFHILNELDKKSSGVRLAKPNSLITAIYTNDGLNCSIEWKAIYPNFMAYRNNYGAVAIDENAVPTHCNPKQGMSQNEKTTITFLLPQGDG